MTARSPLDMLRDDHAAAIEAAGRTGDLVEALADGAAPSRPEAGERLRECIASLRKLLLLHFRREEEALFPEVRALVSEGAPAVDILSRFFEGEADDDLTAHVLMRSRLRELAPLLETTEQEAALGPEQLAALRASVRLLTDVLRRHAEKENSLIFPMIERLLDEEQMKRVAERMGQIRAAT